MNAEDQALQDLRNQINDSLYERARRFILLTEDYEGQPVYAEGAYTELPTYLDENTTTLRAFQGKLEDSTLFYIVPVPKNANKEQWGDSLRLALSNADFGNVLAVTDDYAVICHLLHVLNAESRSLAVYHLPVNRQQTIEELALRSKNLVSDRNVELAHRF